MMKALLTTGDVAELSGWVSPRALGVDRAPVAASGAPSQVVPSR